MKISSNYKVGDIGMERTQDQDGLYTWCSRMSDRITLQA